jgi:hypothetical protein
MQDQASGGPAETDRTIEHMSPGAGVAGGGRMADWLMRVMERNGYEQVTTFQHDYDEVLDLWLYVGPREHRYSVTPGIQSKASVFATPDCGVA